VSRAAQWEALDADWQRLRRELDAKKAALGEAGIELSRAVIAKKPDSAWLAEARAAFEAADAAVDDAREAEYAAYKRREEFSARSAA
jgi:hypothetical protein